MVLPFSSGARCLTRISTSGSSGMKRRLPVAVRRRKRERVRQMADLAHRAIAQQYFHDVEADLHGRVMKQPDVIQRRPRQTPALVCIHGGGGSGPVFGGTRLDLDENKAIAVAKDQINFAAWRTEVGGEKFQPDPAQMFFRGFLAEFAPPQVLGLPVGNERRLDARPQSHQNSSACPAALSGAKL